MKTKSILLAGGTVVLAALVVVLVVGVGGDDEREAAEPAVTGDQPAPRAGPTPRPPPPRHAPVRPPPPARAPTDPAATSPPEDPAAEAPAPEKPKGKARAPVPPNPELTLPIDERRAKLGRKALEAQARVYRDRLTVLGEQIRSLKASVERMQQSDQASREGIAQAQRRLQQLIDAEPRMRVHLKKLEEALEKTKSE